MPRTWIKRPSKLDSASLNKGGPFCEGLPPSLLQGSERRLAGGNRRARACAPPSKRGTARHASPVRGSGAIFTRIVSPRSPRVVVADGPLEKVGTACRVKGECVVADAVEEPAVVRDDDRRARESADRLLERAERINVEVVGRLVEQQEMRRLHRQARDDDAHALPSAKRREGEGGQPAGPAVDAKRAQLAPEVLVLGVGQLVLEPGKPAPRLLVEALREVLAVVRHAQAAVAPHLARARLGLPREQPHQRRLARPVPADERDPAARAERQLDA
mmetsp:Transcript_39341/g.130233  ORF Transcript_39341/g.130233 Transcript_39341/m.130233 type:complete len:274 (-) Transcript_39341:634-1455(-)